MEFINMYNYSISKKSHKQERVRGWPLATRLTMGWSHPINKVATPMKQGVAHGHSHWCRGCSRGWLWFTLLLVLIVTSHPFIYGSDWKPPTPHMATWISFFFMLFIFIWKSVYLYFYLKKKWAIWSWRQTQEANR